jgi:addiction module RelE/StbE family toxin
MEVKWLRRALQGLDAVAAYIAQDNPKAAQTLVKSLREKARQLASFPYMGRVSEAPEIREFVVHEHYLLSYRIRPERIEILQVWHTAQDRRIVKAPRPIGKP